MKQFLTEFFARFGLKTPSFFQIFQWAGIIAGALSGIPLLLTTFEADLHLTLPDWVRALSQKGATVGAIVMWIMAKLPVHNAATVVKYEPNKMPFTAEKELPKPVKTTEEK